MKEIECKLRLNLTEEDLKRDGRFRYTLHQFYLGSGNQPQTRVSKKIDDNGYTTYSLNVKNGEGLSRNEARIPITFEQFNTMKSIATSLVVQRCYDYVIAGHIMEVSVFVDYNIDTTWPDLIVGEIEFPSEKEANIIRTFMKSQSCVEEDVTGDKWYYGYKIGRRL